MKFIWDRSRQEWVEASKFGPEKRSGLQIIGEIESFVSPVTGKVVSNRHELRNHNMENEVIDRRDMKGHRFETPKLPSVTPDLIRAFKEGMGRPV